MVDSPTEVSPDPADGCICDNIVWEDILGQGKYLVSGPFGLVAIAAAEGCHLCSLIYGGLKTYNPQQGFTVLTDACPCLADPTTSFFVAGNDNTVQVQVGCEHSGGDKHMTMLQLSTLPHNLTLDFRIELRDIRNRRRAGPEMIGLDLDELAKAWIHDCAENHSLCPKPQDRILPTRVLDVGEDDSFQDLHLVVPEPGTTGTWTALSYCWGDVDLHYRVTTSNLTAYLQNISFDLLPRTIQDAIIFTRRLGVRYLWVDALCIVQDSKADWEAESPTMMNVFRNAYLTMAANAGDNADSGLCIDRNALESRPCELKFREPDGKSLFRYRWIHPPRQPWERIMSLATLQTRGWTLQESVLSARVIYFDKRGLYWQCREGICQERVAAYLITANDIVVPRRRIFDTYSDDPLNMFDMWEDLVREFTERKLSYQSDKLYAIAGIAAGIASHIKARQHRRLATPEERELYSVRKMLKHWAVPDNPKAQGWLRYDGANSSIRWILSQPGGRAPLYKGGPISMDPWLGLRFTGELDREAEKEFAVLSPRAREIMKEVGMEKLLKFIDDQADNPDYDDEYIHLMSHQDTHAAYMRAYHIWMGEKKRAQQPLELKAAEEGPSKSKPDDPNLPLLDSDPDQNPPHSDRKEDTKANLEAQLAAVEHGVHLDPDLETEVNFPQRTTIYIYAHTSSPLLARTEWPAYICDDTYLAGIWRADMVHQLQWYCASPAGRAATYRAPSWSWASTDDAKIRYKGAKKFDRSEGVSYSKLPRVLEARVVTRGTNRFADAVSGKVVLIAEVRDMPSYAVDENYNEEDQKGVDEEREEKWSQLVTRHVGDGFPEGESNIYMDEKSTVLTPMSKMVRLGDGCCLVAEAAGFSMKDPLVLRRVGCWMSSSEDFDQMKDWKTRLVTLI